MHLHRTSSEFCEENKVLRANHHTQNRAEQGIMFTKYMKCSTPSATRPHTASRKTPPAALQAPKYQNPR